MTDREVKLAVGGLLHDIGKVIFREGSDKRNHSQSGYDYLREEVGLDDADVLHCVHYHHFDQLKSAKLPQDDLAYIVYMADNIASAADRRKKEYEEKGFEITAPLQSVFNLLNGNHEEYYYHPSELNPNEEANYPQAKKEQFDVNFYRGIKCRITDNLRGRDWNQEYLNSLLGVLEAALSFVPSSTSRSEVADISLYDHVKLTAAVANCIYAYLDEKGEHDYREILFQNGSRFYEVNAFLLFSMDVSGIQKFIYTITTKNALRTLRARSFYLEILMEHVIDGILDRLRLSRANLIYSGGGHCYMLLPNTEHAKMVVEQYISELNQWLLKQFKTALYIAGGYAECSSNTLKNVPDGSYADLFRTVSSMISRKKSSRYSAEDISELNEAEVEDYTRECKVCRRIGRVGEDGVCPLCRKIEHFSGHILYQEFFTVLTESKEDGLPLPGNCILVADDEKAVRKRMLEDNTFVRTYSKNNLFTGKHVATKLWVGDYTTGQTFEEFAETSEGIKRIGVLRADVDNLGHAFVSGFDNPANQNRYVTLSRTATLSRQLSLFFKLYINQILEKPEFTIGGSEKEARRNATIVYSGGDDLFIVGAWKDVIELAVDIREKFKAYTQGTLTLSAGIGTYSSSYPIHAIASEVAEMEEESKSMPKKNAVTFLEDGEKHEIGSGKDVREISDGTYSWDEFEWEVIGGKFKLIRDFFDSTEDRGKAFLYNLLEFVRNQREKINFARYVYLLSRLEPDAKKEPEKAKQYNDFSEKMYDWIKSEKDRRQLKTAITMYAYLTREQEGTKDDFE